MVAPGAGAGGAQPAALLPLTARPRWQQLLVDHLSIARPDHWFKNVFMLAGIVLAVFYDFAAIEAFSPLRVLVALAAVCLAASSNYTINEILDAPSDLHHPKKWARPIPSGRVPLASAYLQWLVLGGLSCLVASLIGTAFLLATFVLLMMGVVYNVPPLRTKELPYLDVLSESVNNPLRLALGWFVVSPLAVPPLSLVISYWMVGAFFMATKRFAEYRMIDNKAAAAAYRSSFRFYDQNRLLVSMFVYATAAALFLGFFIVRYKLELVLITPLMAGFFGYYLHIALQNDSPVQAPEHLYREWGLMLYLCVCLLLFAGLMFVHVPGLYDLFNVNPSPLPQLWEI